MQRICSSADNHQRHLSGRISLSSLNQPLSGKLSSYHVCVSFMLLYMLCFFLFAGFLTLYLDLSGNEKSYK